MRQHGRQACRIEPPHMGHCVRVVCRLLHHMQAFEIVQCVGACQSAHIHHLAGMPVGIHQADGALAALLRTRLQQPHKGRHPNATSQQHQWAVVSGEGEVAVRPVEVGSVAGQPVKPLGKVTRFFNEHVHLPIGQWRARDGKRMVVVRRLAVHAQPRKLARLVAHGPRLVGL